MDSIAWVRCASGNVYFNVDVDDDDDDEVFLSNPKKEAASIGSLEEKLPSGEDTTRLVIYLVQDLLLELSSSTSISRSSSTSTSRSSSSSPNTTLLVCSNFGFGSLIYSKAMGSG